MQSEHVKIGGYLFFFGAIFWQIGNKSIWTLNFIAIFIAIFIYLIGS